MAFATIVSCNKEIELVVEDNQLIIEEIEVEDGILSFTSKDFLKSTIENLKEITDDEKEVKLAKFYNRGFMPLYPHFDESNKEMLLEFSDRKKNKAQKLISLNPSAREIPTEIDEEGELVEEFDDDLISDDEFASILNDEREVIVNDTLYKYTYSGMFSVHKYDKQSLYDYIEDNNIEYLVPDASTLDRGEVVISPEITKYIPTEQRIAYPNEPCSFSQLEQYFEDDCYSGGGSGSGGSSGGDSGGGSSSPTIDHTESLVNLVDDLGPCDTLTGFLDGFFQVFGVSRKCYANFDSKYRTKTKYWKENYGIWHSIGVKVKHQKKGWTGLWRAKKTDEVALVISQATFKYKLEIPNFPQSYQPAKLYFFEDKVFNSQSQLLTYQNNSQKPSPPALPFNSEVIVTEFVNDTFNSDLSVANMRQLFYQGVWQGAKLITNHYKNRQPKNVTHILYTPTKVFVNYVDLERRELNSKKIVNQLDYNFGLGVKFNAYIDGDGNITTNWGDFLNDPLGNLGFIVIPKLYDYDDVKMDFVGASRRGETWKGSRIVYTD